MENLIYGPGRHILKFVLNSTVDWVKTPALLKSWGLIKNGSCPLCKHPKCSLHHILVNCPVALSSKRYTWRHESILAKLGDFISTNLLKLATIVPPSSFTPIEFVPAGFKKKGSTSTKRPNLLSGATDWILMIDLDHLKLVFPPEIFRLQKDRTF